VTARDRTVLIVVGLLAALAAFWFLAVSPKRKEATDLSSQVTSAESRLAAAQASAANAAAAKARYDADYATVARLGKAVPADADVPSLMYQLETTAHANKVDFRKVSLTGSSSSVGTAPTTAAAAAASVNGGTAASGGSAVTAALPPGATVGPAGFPTMPFSFQFNGSFFSMQKFRNALGGLTTVKGDSISVKGRLLTVDGVNLKAGPKGFPQVQATVAVTAYLLPSDEGLTAGATAAAPTSSTTTGGPSAALTGSDR